MAQVSLFGTEKPAMVPINEECPFEFDLVKRNLALAKAGIRPPKATSTGTTTVGCTFKDGVVVGADSRATNNNLIADKECNKLHKLTDSIYACGAGTAADLDQVTKLVGAQLRLMELNTGRPARVISALRHVKQHLFNYQGHVGAYLIIGGVDEKGPWLYEASAGGSSNQLPFTADGSGGMNAIAVLEDNFKENMSEEEAVALVKRALEAGMHGDLFSGNSLRYAVITKEGTKTNHNIKPPFTESEPKGVIGFHGQTTSRLSTEEKKILREKVKSTKVVIITQVINPQSFYRVA